MQKLIIRKVDQTFDPQNDLVLGPWCFQGAEDIYSEWDKLDFVAAFANGHENAVASKNSYRLFEERSRVLGKNLNQQHGVEYSFIFWRHVLCGWMQLLIHFSYARYRHIQNFIARHQDKDLEVKITPLAVEWNIYDTHTMSATSSHPDFDYWLSSFFIRHMAPANWELVEDTSFPRHISPEKDAARPQNESLERPSWRERLREKILNFIDRSNFGFVYGTTWKSQLVLAIFLKILPRFKSKHTYYDMLSNYNPTEYFPSEYLDLLTQLENYTQPQSLTKDFETYDVPARNVKYKPGRLRVETTDIHKEDRKFIVAHALTNGEKVVKTQHGCWYGVVSNICISPSVEYPYHTFLSWGWNQHDEYQGHFVPISSPMPTMYKDQHHEQEETLIFVDGMTNLLSERLSGQPGPKYVVDKRHHKFEFFEALSANIIEKVAYRPHIYHSHGVNDVKPLMQKFRFKELFDKPGLDQRLLGCKLQVIDHYGTTMHTGLAWNIPTVCYWSEGFPDFSATAKADFEELRKHGILFYNATEAADHINNIWPNVQEWWQNPELQRARKKWCYKYARSSRLWPLHWLWMFLKLTFK